MTAELTTEHAGVQLRHYVARPAGNARGAVLICHTWGGRSAFECGKADALAELGFYGIAVDLYGDARCGSSVDENVALMTPLREDRALLRQRLQAVLKTVTDELDVAAQQVVAMGFCFGGLCVLDLARSAADIAGVVSFHGILDAPPLDNRVQCKVLVLHGHLDPMVPIEQVVAFTEEMQALDCDWQLHTYGQSLHAFSNPAANDRDFGTVYNADADARSWQSLRNFLDELLPVT